MEEWYVDMENLIELVHRRPVLWDKSHPGYRNKQNNYIMWRAICMVLNDSYSQLSDKDKDDFCKQVMKKWANARDNWIKCEKKLKMCDPNAKPVQKYKYYKQLEFLSKVVNHNLETSEASGSNDKEENEPPKKKRTIHHANSDDIDRRIPESIEREDGRIMSFFRGIAPTIEKFDDTDIVEFQYQVTKLMRNINAKYVHQLPCNVDPGSSQDMFVECALATSSGDEADTNKYPNYDENDMKPIIN